jgi:phytoene dehydrogenase-like protein
VQEDVMEKSVIIIGAGVAGLSAGCYLRMNGYRTHIFEMDTRPGGVCTAWKRNGYTIDGCMEWLVGSGPASAMHRVWQELGIPQRHSFIDHDTFIRVEGRDGRTLSLYVEPDRLEQHLLELAPEDAAPIRDLTNVMRKLKRFDMPVRKPAELEGPLGGLRTAWGFLPYMGVLRRWGKVTVGGFTSRLKSPFLREALLAAVSDAAEFPVLGLLMPMTWVRAKAAGYPLGGSFEFARTIEQRYLGLGGEVSYRSRVARILVENDRAVGVRLAHGTEHRAETVISAADGRTTIFDMLDGTYADEKVKGYYQDSRLYEPLVFVSFGMARTFPDVPPSVSGLCLPLDEPRTIAGRERKHLLMHPYHFDPSMAPEGRTVFRVMLGSPWEYWEELQREPERYRAEKERVAEQVLAVLERRFPGLTGQVEMRDVATPVTLARYTGNWRGSFMGWRVTQETFNLRMKKTLPGLGQFYMVGQWVEPGGGLPPAALSGRHVTQLICKRDGKEFMTRVP